MKWSNLKENKCPQCDKDFTKGMLVTMEEDFLGDTPAEKFISHSCGFKIRESRYSQIVNSQITQDLEDKWNKEIEE